MKCPIQQGLLKSEGDRTVIEWADCIKEECAWWHTGLEECKFASLEDEIATIMGTLLNLSLDLDKSGKLPHWKPTAKEKAELKLD